MIPGEMGATHEDYCVRAETAYLRDIVKALTMSREVLLDNLIKFTLSQRAWPLVRTHLVIPMMVQ